MNYMDAVHSVPRSCLCCSPSSSALIPALLSSSNTTVFSACFRMPGGATTAARPSTLSCWSLGWSRDRPWRPGPSAAPTPGPAPAPTTRSGASSCFWVMAGFFKAVDKLSGKAQCSRNTVSIWRKAVVCCFHVQWHIREWLFLTLLQH